MEPAEAPHDAEVPAALGERGQDDLGQEEQAPPAFLRADARAPAIAVGAVIAWALTLAPSGFGRASSMLGSVLAVASLACGVAGPFVARRRQRLGRHVGISLFAALATLTWLREGYSIQPLRLDPVRGVLGALAWGVFALAWSERWSGRASPVPIDTEAPLLLPRAPMSPLAAPLATLGIASALGYVVLAFRVRDPERAVVTQAVALACAVAVVVAAGAVATTWGKPRAASTRKLNPPVVRALLLLVTTAIAGAVITALR
jgi:hypothetical protein